MQKIKIKRKVKPLGNKKYPLDKMKVGDMFEAGEYTDQLQRSIYGSIAFFKKKAGNSKKVFSCLKMENGKLGVWRDK